MKRDITPPLRDPEPRARGGMTVVDESAWKRAINEYTKAESIAFLRAADQFASGVERHMRARPDLSFEVVCAGIGEAPLAPDAAALREFWIYGPRFWAWWQGRQKPAKAPEPDAGHAAGAARARVPGDQIRTHTGWHTVTAAEHPAYARVATESGMWSRGAILETRRKDEAKPTTLAAPPGCDPGGPARNVPIRVGDYVRARDQSGRCDFDFWARVTGVSDAASEYVKCVGLDPACEYHVPLSCVADHRPAPRITLPDGREVVPERMWLSTNEAHGSVAYANVGNCAYYRVRGTSQWNPIGDPWRDEQMTESAERTWPPAECEGT